MASHTYWPPREPGSWQASTATPSGVDREALAAAVAFAEAHDNPWPRTFYYPDGRYVGIVEWNEIGPWSDIVGPVAPRGAPAGLVLQGGRLVAEWGDTRRPDMTFSVAKSYLALLAGVALGDGVIPDLDAPVGQTVAGPWFASSHNARITWRHLLQQSSEWQGELWGKSDQVDHNRQVGLGADNSRKCHKRELQTPGTYYEYNDVRVNVLALALLHVFRRPLPEILKERIMDPIGASEDWRWHGYSTSWIEIDGRRTQSVSGGAHWGGGIFISARDHARVGLLVARRGIWAGRSLIPAGYIDAMLSPSPTNPSYGFLWWLNRGGARHKSVSDRSVFALGAGGNVIWIEPDLDLVAVMRWIDNTAVDGFLGRIARAFTPGRTGL
jgi:CubicO group peptidase (beta-lactamase class C family)